MQIRRRRFSSSVVARREISSLPPFTVWLMSPNVCLQDIVRRGEIIDNDLEDEFYLRRLDAGLFVLQHICYIMAEICNANVPQVWGASPWTFLSLPPSRPPACVDSQGKKWVTLSGISSLCGPTFLGVGRGESRSCILVSVKTNVPFSFSPFFPFVRFAREFTRS